MRIRTYYRGHDAVVTSELFAWDTSPAKTFVIRELKNAVIARPDVNRKPVYAALIAGSVAVTGAVSPILDSPLLLGAVFLAVAVPGVVAAAFWRRARTWELHATYRNAAIVLYESSDARVFHQVGRALQRAMEDADPHARRHGEAA